MERFPTTKTSMGMYNAALLGTDCKKAENMAIVGFEKIRTTKDRRLMLCLSERDNVAIVGDMYSLPKQNKACSVLQLIFHEIIDNATDKGKLINREIRFSTKDMVKYGIYGRNHEAKERFPMLCNFLGSLQFKIVSRRRGEDIKTRQQVEQVIKETAPLFTKITDVDDETVTLMLNPDADWKHITKRYIYAPMDILGLPGRLPLVAINLLNIAWQQPNIVKRDGVVKIKMRDFAVIAMLPNEKQTDKVKRDIKEAADSYINSLSEILESTDYKIEKHYDFSHKIKVFLDEDEVWIYVSGETRERISNMMNPTSNKLKYLK